MCLNSQTVLFVVLYALSLGYNGIGDDGAVAVSEALSKCANLQYLE